MTEKDRAELRLSCFYAASNVTGVNSASMKGKRGRPTTEKILVEAKKISEWVIKESEPA